MMGSVKEFLVHVSWNLNKVKFCIQCIFSVICIGYFFGECILCIWERERDKAYIFSVICIGYFFWWMYTVHLREREREIKHTYTVNSA